MSIKWPTNWFDDPTKIYSRQVASTIAAGGVGIDVPLSKLTTFRIGGPARVLVEPLTPESAVEVVRRAIERNITLKILGFGSNLLASDAGVDGVVLTTTRMRRATREDDRYTLWAGSPLVGFVNDAAKAGLSGVEGIIGIPANLGGAIAMNAGGKWGEIFDVVESVTVCDLRTAEVRTLQRHELNPHYRDANLGQVLVLSTVLRLKPADPKVVVETTRQHLMEKNRAQPVTEPSAGCIFRNPKPAPGGAKLAAAALIDQSGLKGTRIGGVEVSHKHANYFVNLGNGTCNDALALMDLVRERVHREFNVILENEVKLW